MNHARLSARDFAGRQTSLRHKITALRSRMAGHADCVYHRPSLLSNIGMADAEFSALIHTHRGYLLRVAVLQLRDSDLAEDVVQDTLVAALQGAKGFSGRSSLKTWLTGILKHKIVDAIRRKKREPAFATLEDECQLEDMDALFDESGHWDFLLNDSAATE